MNLKSKNVFQLVKMIRRWQWRRHLKRLDSRIWDLNRYRDWQGQAMAAEEELAFRTSRAAKIRQREKLVARHSP